MPRSIPDRANSRAVRVTPTTGDKLKMERALDDLELLLNGPWLPIVEAWRLADPNLRDADAAPLFGRLLNIIEGLR